MATLQAARFYINSKFFHERAIDRIGIYLKDTKGKGIILKQNNDEDLEFYVDTDFAGGRDKVDSGNPEAVLSRTGYVVMYANYPVIWCYKLQTEIVLSTMESNYISLIQATR